MVTQGIGYRRLVPEVYAAKLLALKRPSKDSNGQEIPPRGAPKKYPQLQALIDKLLLNFDLDKEKGCSPYNYPMDLTNVHILNISTVTGNRNCKETLDFWVTSIQLPLGRS